jgi:hypothetical protein
MEAIRIARQRGRARHDRYAAAKSPSVTAERNTLSPYGVKFLFRTAEIMSNTMSSPHFMTNAKAQRWPTVMPNH